MTETAPPQHTPFEDAQGLLFGGAMAAFGIVILQSLGFITGQIAGLSVLISYMTGWGFGPVFFALNLPFYWFGYKRMGARFVVKTFIAVLLLSVLAQIFPHYVRFGTLNPLIGAAMYGFISGAALLALFRHGASLGGVGIMSLYLQDKTGFKAGWTQMIFDACVFVLALFVLPLQAVGWSFVGAVVLNMVIAVNHRRDHYIAG
ncbi:YitT family protein [Paenirhodobacter enshiensis]|uniref:YitT family protein n=1 Tax=Paenirhodobacter enshiensis TaxID=1105367 RepID=UPI0035AEFC8F